MRNLIDHFRSKTPEERDRLIWITAGIAVIVMLAIWIIVGNGEKFSGSRGFINSFSDQFMEAQKNFKDYQKK